MSFYTALTGLNGSQADISATSNNIANVGTTGFKRSRAEFGDIFATSPLQNSSSSIGSGTILKGIKQQFTQGNIVSSLNALDLAISGQGFFALKPSLTSAQTVYTRNGSLNVNNDRYVVDSAGQYLLVYPVNDDGSVTAKDLTSAVPLQLPVTSGEPKATSNIELGVNVPADAAVVPEKAIFADGYTFDPNNSESFTNSTSITIFDDLGNPTIATIYFIKTQNASATDPTNKFDTRLVINDTVIDPDLVNAVDDSGRQIFIDRFGNQTTAVPDDNYFLEGKGSPLYKLDDLQTQIPSQPATLTGEQTSFDFGEEGNKLVEIVTDPMQFLSTREGGNDEGSVYWGKDFLLLNIDDGDQPVSIDIRAGKYNAEQLAAEVQRAINESYGDDRKIQVVQNVDDKLTIDLLKLNADGVPTGLTNKISVDLLKSSFVSEQIPGLDVDGASPDFTLEQFLAHAQARLNDTLNKHAVSVSTSGVETVTNAELGVSNKLFARTSGAAITTPLENTQIIELDHTTLSDADADGVFDTASSDTKYAVYSFYGRRPNLSVYDQRSQVSAPLAGANTVTYDSAQNTLSITVSQADAAKFTTNETIRLAGVFANDTSSTLLNGREFTIFDVTNTAANATTGAAAFSTIKIDTTGLSLPDTGFTDDSTDIYVMDSKSSDVEAFFEGAESVYDGANVNFNSKKIVFREIGTSTLHSYTNDDVKAIATNGIFTVTGETLSLTDASGTSINALSELGLQSALGADVTTTETNWVDEKNPPITITYDDINQRLAFSVDRTVLGTGTDSNFNSFRISGAANAEGSNNLGIPAGDDAIESLIRGGEILYTESFVADGEEVQLNDKRFGAKVGYNSDTKTFTFSSGTTGEAIDANGAIGVGATQKASNIQVGRYAISAIDGSVINNTADLDSRAIGVGDNLLMGVGATKTEAVFLDGRGLLAEPAKAQGGAANESLTEVFRLSSQNGENIFNVSVNGINGVIEIPTGNYVGSTLASALQERINQIRDPLTGQVVGGVKVSYNAETNNFSFVTGTTGDTSTIKVKGASRLGLDDVPLGVGSVPEIYNLVQATNADGVALYVDADGNVAETPPANLVEGYYPLYIDEGELTFDKTGKLLSPKNKVKYEKQEEGFSISLDIDFGASTQFAQPFSVLSVEQDGFTSGRLDGLEIDASGTIRANYTNGQNNPLGKIVVANFNNQNGLKQIGNATYVETAVSGTPQVGEAGAEGYGNILSGSLERSNVDITEELVNLITAQRNFQASAKAIETTTTLTQTIINIRM